MRAYIVADLTRFIENKVHECGTLSTGEVYKFLEGNPVELIDDALKILSDSDKIRISGDVVSAVSRTIYLANPYGFSASAKKSLLPTLVHTLKDMGAEVWEPFERNNQVDFSKSDWAYKVGQADVNDVKNSDAIFAVVNGCPPDEGVMVELGLAMALNKKIFLYRDDFRNCTDSGEYPLNLMVFAGLPQDSWRDYYYMSESELKDPNKALARWLNGKR